MAPADGRLAALRAAEQELTARGRLSPATVDTLRAEFGLAGSHSGPRHSLIYRDDVIEELAACTSGANWRRAGIVAEWLRRWSTGDPLHDAPAEVATLCAAVGKALSQRQCFRVLCGDRSR